MRVSKKLQHQRHTAFVLRRPAFIAAGFVLLGLALTLVPPVVADPDDSHHTQEDLIFEPNVYDPPIIDITPPRPVRQVPVDQPTPARAASEDETGESGGSRRRSLRRTSGPPHSNGCDCKTSDFDISPNGTATTQCNLKPLTDWIEGLSDTPAETLNKWVPRGTSKPLWIAFVGDSQLRLEFWHLVRILGRHNQYRVSPAFASVAFEPGNPKAAALIENDQDPVPNNAKWMDYTFCCKDLADPDSCLLSIGGSNTTKNHVPKNPALDKLVDTVVDFNDAGQVVAEFLEAHKNENQPMCLSYQMAAFPRPNVLPVILGKTLRHARKPTTLLLDPGLLPLILHGTKRMTLGLEEHLNGLDMLSDALQQYPSPETKVILHNVMWANEEALTKFYMRRSKTEGTAFQGLLKGVEKWNAATASYFKHHKSLSVELVDMNTISNQLTHTILHDHVHFDRPIYMLQLWIDLNIIFNGVSWCW